MSAVPSAEAAAAERESLLKRVSDAVKAVSAALRSSDSGTEKKIAHGGGVHAFHYKARPPPGGLSRAPCPHLSPPSFTPRPHQVQREYAGKGELATGRDSRVTTLCAQLEAIFCHGLKANRRKGAELSAFEIVALLRRRCGAASSTSRATSVRRRHTASLTLFPTHPRLLAICAQLSRPGGRRPPYLLGKCHDRQRPR